MSYTDLRDFAPEISFPIRPFGIDLDTLHRVTVELQIEKLGGGTLGKAYTGAWRWQLRVDDVVMEYGQDLETPMPTTHIQAGKILAEFLTQNEEGDNPNSPKGRIYEWLSYAFDDDTDEIVELLKPVRD